MPISDQRKQQEDKGLLPRDQPFVTTDKRGKKKSGTIPGGIARPGQGPVASFDAPVNNSFGDGGQGARPAPEAPTLQSTLASAVAPRGHQPRPTANPELAAAVQPVQAGAPQPNRFVNNATRNLIRASQKDLLSARKRGLPAQIVDRKARQLSELLNIASGNTARDDAATTAFTAAQTERQKTLADALGTADETAEAGRKRLSEEGNTSRVVNADLARTLSDRDLTERGLKGAAGSKEQIVNTESQADPGNPLSPVVKTPNRLVNGQLVPLTTAELQTQKKRPVKKGQFDIEGDSDFTEEELGRILVNRALGL